MFGKKGSKILKLPSVRSCVTLAMTNKLVVIINSLKLPKIKKILLYEMKFLVPNYSCFQNPWLGAAAPRSTFSLSSTEFVDPPPTKFLGKPLPMILYSVTRISEEEYKSWNCLLYVFSDVLSRRLRPNYLGTVLSNNLSLSSHLLIRFGHSAASVVTGWGPEARTLIVGRSKLFFITKCRPVVGPTIPHPTTHVMDTGGCSFRGKAVRPSSNPTVKNVLEVYTSTPTWGMT